MSSFIMTSLTKIARAWAAALTTDADLASWCQQECGKVPAVFMATANSQDCEWGRNDAPYIAILPPSSRTGAEVDVHEYEFFLHLGLVMTGYVEGVAWKEPKGFGALEQSFATLVLEALATTDYAPDEIEAETFPAQANFFEMVMAITVRVPFTIGGPERTIG